MSADRAGPSPVGTAGVGSRPLVSAVIPTYRRANLLLRAIRSALNQTVRDLEVVVVDDASRDGTQRAVQQIRDPRIRYIEHAKNKGLPASRNTGIRAARGAFIAFLDDDDEWLPDKTAKQLQCLAEQGLDAIVGLGLINGKIPGHGFHRGLLTLEDLRRGNKWGSCTLLARREVMQTLMFDESLTVGEDWDMYIRIAEKYRLGCLNETVFVYHQSGLLAAPQRMLDAADDGRLDEGRFAALRKHRATLGEKWFNRLMARALLSHIARRPHRLRVIADAIHQCGAVAVLMAVASRATWYAHSVRWLVKARFLRGRPGPAATAKQT